MQQKPGTKCCPFCGETIQAVAIKCRFCGEWLENPAKCLTVPAQQQACGSSDDGQAENVFESSPSYISMLGAFISAFFLVVLAFVIMFVPVDKDSGGLQTAKIIIGLIILLFTACWMLARTTSLKSTSYRLTPERLEYRHGLLFRKTDNIDLFRVVDYQMQRTLLDQLFKIGTIKILTSDKVNPEIELYKIKYPQKAYDLLKKTTTAADSRSNVVHLE